MDATNELQWRGLHLLHVHRDTLRCALTRCIACCYKIVLHNRPGLLPNVRPEMCPRMTPKVKNDDDQKMSAEADNYSIGLYDAAQVKRILTVGDGNFSYSLALARALGPDSGVQLVTTSHESKKTVLETYPDGEKILDELNAMPHVTVQHEVDATDAEQMKTLGQFDRVIWNFPCVRAPRGEDGQNQEMETNKKLLSDFFAHVAQILTPTGEVHVTHKTKKPFGQWGIENIAKTNKLRHQQSVVFDRCLYPGYSNKKVLSKGSFPIWDSLTFIFVPEDRTHPETPENGKPEDSDNIPVEPVTMDILKKLYLLLTPSLDDMLGSKKKKKGFKGLNSNQKDVTANHKGNKDTSDHKSNNTHKGNNNKRKQPVSGHSKGGKRKKGRRS
ncbi:hypothetical protein L914_14152 [Phytophthora nicotianae]|uniref:25S rRNA (uridine-N(3))-methyltransferase BMT5-like domain-containing protein n=2 Tax=Phytophthora nicotianae TaxID=4792 RepID=V9ELC1_PHYNI|nr:hypothetical protein F443_14710 [Phytophthora nicotianae P1569]ETM39717.1 hypothetical protein L914_14152 [Phytophthora nicotianae]